jgi:hypothetical protein
MEWLKDTVLFLIELAGNIMGIAIVIAIIVALFKLTWRVTSEVWKGIDQKSYDKSMDFVHNKIKVSFKARKKGDKDETTV